MYYSNHIDTCLKYYISETHLSIFVYDGHESFAHMVFTFLSAYVTIILLYIVHKEEIC